MQELGWDLPDAKPALVVTPLYRLDYTTALGDHFDSPGLSSKGENYLSSEDFTDDQVGP